MNLVCRSRSSYSRACAAQGQPPTSPSTSPYGPSGVEWLGEGRIEGFLRREVLPYAADAWYDPGSVRTGYEISFTRYFYKPQPLRSLAEIQADILALERETEGLLGEIVGDGGL